MSFPYTPKLQDEKIESLQTQHEYLHLLRLRHLQWRNATIDADIGDVHLEIAELLGKIDDHYSQLLAKPRGQTHTG